MSAIATFFLAALLAALFRDILQEFRSLYRYHRCVVAGMSKILPGFSRISAATAQNDGESQVASKRSTSISQPHPRG